jgi:NAD(P)-dependent dehydrogenase (short-subunit alcohol dehydrogenase family)
VFSNTTAAPHASDPVAIKSALVEHLLRPVRFSDEIRAMHDAGARIFVETGPGKVLTGLVTQTLAGREFTAIAMDQPGRHGVVQMAHALAQLASLGVRIHLQKLFEGRAGTPIVLSQLAKAAPVASPSSQTTWTITAGRAVPPRAQQAAAERPAARRDAPVRTMPAAVAPIERAAPAAVSVAPAASSGAGATVAHAAPVDASAAAALSHHHKLMARFLETHQNIMLEYLGAAAVDRAPAGLLASDEVRAPAVLHETVAVAAVPVAPVTPVEAASPASPMIAASPAGPVAPVSEDEMIRQIVALVCERTGYPPDMLGLDLDLEADLGVDSIKRVEIVSAMQNLGLLAGRDNMEVLAKLKTIRAIAKWIVSSPQDGGVAPPARATEETGAPSAELAPLTRMTVSVVDAPASTTDATADVPGAVLITDAGGPLARLISDRLATRGIAAEIVSVGSDPAASGPHLEISSLASAASIVDTVRHTRGPVAALVHAAPIEEPPADGDTAFFERVRREVYPLLLLARAAESDLRKVRGSVTAATALGGAFAFDRADADRWPGSGAVSGFVKTLAREWPEVACKTIDFERAASPDRIADAIVSELVTRDGLTEVGYQGARRVSLEARPAPLGQTPRLTIDRRSVILVTGGARGITAEVARELAERFQPTLVLAGRSPLPDAEETPEVACCADSRELKAMLIGRHRGERPIVPVQIEAECRRILHAREVRATLAALKQTGATVEYHAVDVADAGRFEALLDDVTARHGRIDGVVHGAGIIEDKLVADKTVDSFDRVLRPKVAGALTLLSKLRPDALKFLVFFSSVSARFGNRGQCDYAAANEVLNKLAATRTCGQARIVSVNWGPWESSGGMVSADLAQRFAEAGVRLISRPHGRKAFVDELLYGDRGDVEVIWGDRLPDAAEQADADGPRERSTAAYPLVSAAADGSRHDDRGRLQLAVHTSPALDAYLNDHMLDGVPVMPMVVAMELMGEAAAVYRGGACTSISDLRVLNGITYPGFAARTLRIEAGDAPDRAGDVAVSVASDGERSTPHYRAVVTCRPRLETPPRLDPLQLVEARPLALSIDEAYQRWLFHGPRFAGIASVEGVGDNGIVGRVRASSPAEMLGRHAPGSWFVDPLVIDSGLQLVILWARMCFDETPLPSRLRSFHRYVDVLPADLVCEALVERLPRTATLVSDIRFFDAGHRLLLRLIGMEATCSAALNRLSDAKVQGAGVS